MDCIYCGNKSLKYGHTEKGRQRWRCKKCGKTFTELTAKGMKPNRAPSFPFEVIALVLHWQKITPRRNRFLRWIANVVCEELGCKKKVSRQNINSWIRNPHYNEVFDKVISREEAMRLWKKAYDKKYKLSKRAEQMLEPIKEVKVKDGKAIGIIKDRLLRPKEEWVVEKMTNGFEVSEILRAMRAKIPKEFLAKLWNKKASDKGRKITFDALFESTKADMKENPWKYTFLYYEQKNNKKR